MDEKDVTPPTNGAANPEQVDKPEMPKQFDLSKMERLQLENIQLRGQLLQQQQKDLGIEQGAWGQDVAAAHGVDMSKYNINLSTGQCTLVQVGEPQQPGADGGES